MEHLYYKPVSSNELFFLTDIHDPSLLQADSEAQRDASELVDPRTTYLGFRHDASDVLNLKDYPAEYGIDIALLEKGQFRQCLRPPPETTGQDVGHQIAAFLQSWLYFGFLQSIISTRVDVSYLTRTDNDGNVYLCTSDLPRCLHDWVFDVLSVEDRELVKENLHCDLLLEHTWLQRLTMWIAAPPIDCDYQYPGFISAIVEILPATIRLFEAVDSVRLRAFQGETPPVAFVLNEPRICWESRAEELQQLGWCKFQCQLMDDTLNKSALAWITASGLDQDPRGHETCTRLNCDGNNVDSSTYQQAHVSQDCNCDKMLPDASVVMQILMQDEIPVISVADWEGKLSLQVTSRQKIADGDYIAISHVWADGMGGATEKGLNQCQVRKLHQLCSSYQPSSSNMVHFWLDSLCIPRVDQTVYIKALVGIRDVYECAHAVLVVDKMIQRCFLEDRPELLFARVHLSPWMQRMWTFEEAALARKLGFAVADGIYTIDPDKTWPEPGHALAIVYNNLAASMRSLRPTKLDIAIIHEAFRYRLTNARGEEFLSIGGMLGIDTEKLLQFRGDDRTANFWLSLRAIPSDILSLDLPRLSIPGFRWAPRSLMSPTSSNLSSLADDKDFECTLEGLTGRRALIKHDALAFHSNSIINMLVRPSNLETAQTGSATRSFVKLFCLGNIEKDQNLVFDHVLLRNLSSPIPSRDVITTPAAVLKMNDLTVEHHTKKFQFVGRLMCQCIADSTSSETWSLAYDEDFYDAYGTWDFQDVVIT